MVSLQELQQYCHDKSIIIVGNSINLLRGNNHNLIDSYDIVVRINNGYKGRGTLFSNYIGTKTNILSIGIKSAAMATNIIGGNFVNYILSPIISSDKLNYTNTHQVARKTYNELKEVIGAKPSTGISTYNFFNKFIDYKRLDLIGFDFFVTSSMQRNQLGHIKVKDHIGSNELEFFNKTRNLNKTKLQEIANSAPLPPISVYPHVSLNQNKQFTIKNIKKR
tara:strand:+ start:6365 stop:7027 length:663 start_codon:yes stop_codon:yes gene_type:complete